MCLLCVPPILCHVAESKAVSDVQGLTHSLRLLLQQPPQAECNHTHNHFSHYKAAHISYIVVSSPITKLRIATIQASIVPS